jgi:TolB-like protein/cytochrome c-type biogenesis protein CcmH/NrfG
MSPEQLRGERLDERTDVWAAGAVLYELATGRRPFVGEPQARLIAAILHDEPSGLRELNAKLTADLERIALRCLEKDPDHRYQTARDLAAELKRLQAPVSSGASRAAVPARRPAPSRPLVLGGIVVAAAVIVVAGLLVFDVGGIRQRLLPVNPATGASIAVLPLANLSGDPAQEYFADGMTDELITRLAQVSGLKVISRTSSMQYKGTGKPVAQIARELGVKLLVQGTVQRAGEQVQVRAQLVEAATDRNLWADSFQRGAGDVFEIQAEVVRGVVDRIKVNLTPDDRARLVRTQPVRAEAHEAYLRGRYAASRLNAEELGRAVEFFNQALRLEPGYAQAWAGLAGAYYGLSSTFLPANEIMPKIRAAANRAIELDPGLPEAHVLLSHVAGAYERDWKTAEKELQEAIRLGPNISEAHAAYAGSLQIRGNLDRAQTEYERALELDPLSTVLANYTVWCLYLRGRYDEAIARLDGLVRLAPDDAQTWYNLGQCYLQKREYTRAISDLQKAVDLADGPWPLGMLGYAYAVAGRTSDARAVLGRMAEAAKVSQLAPFAFASVYSGLGDRDRCFEWLEKAYAGHDENLLNLKVDPVLASVRSDPRFASLTRRIGLE